MSDYDLIIRGGTILDGRGGAAYTGDVAVAQGVIAEVGGVVEGSAFRELDADGALVTPGFVDTHSHYDGQVVWDPLVWSSSLHGTTTTVNGNCGIGFAPVRERDRQELIDLMESIEEIPAETLSAGLQWRWETFGEYLDALGPHDIDVAVLVAHNALRLYVMGERAEGTPTSEDLQAMASIMGAAMQGGAAGFSTSRAKTHRDKRGEPVPARYAESQELLAIAVGMGRGIFQVAGATEDYTSELASSGVRLVYPFTAGGDGVAAAIDGWREKLLEVDDLVANGGDVWLQVAPRPVGVLLGLEATMNPFSGIPAYEEISSLPVGQRAVAMTDPERRKRILEGVHEPRLSGKGFQGVLRTDAFDMMWPLGDPPHYEPRYEDSIRAKAGQAGLDPAELAYDLVVADGGRSFLYFAFFGYAGYSLDGALEAMHHDRAVVGLGDGGAHLGSVCDSTYPTTMLAYWARDRVRGQRLELPWVIQALTRRPAEVFGLRDRGALVPGLKADLNLIDFPNLRMCAPQMVHDLPGGRSRLVQDAQGYLATIVSGEVVYENGEHTGALPGRVVRSFDWSRS